MKTENVNYKKCSSKFKCFFALLMAFSLVLQLPGVSSIIMAAEPNKPPVVTSDAEEITQALSAADTALNPTYYIMGKPTSGFTSIDNIGDKDAPSIKISPVISAVDEDGTLSAVRELGGNHQENVSAFGLSFEKASDNSKLSILGKYDLEPGGLLTRYAEFSDNDGSKVEYRYKILAYTDQLKDDEPIVKSFGKSVSNDDIFSKLNLAIKGDKYSKVYDSYQDYFRETFTTKYAVRSVVGYKRDLGNYTTNTDLASISDNEPGIYEVKVKTTNPWGQEVYNIVKVRVKEMQELFTPQAPTTKVPVENPAKLKPEEKEAVKKAIDDANKNLPAGTIFDVDTYEDGTVVVRYPDGTTDTIPGTDVVKQSDVATNNPVAPDKKVPVTNPNALTEDEKKAVEAAIKEKNPALPEKTKIAVGNDGTVTITYPDGTKDTIEGAKVVKQSDAATVTPVAPITKVPVSNPAKLTASEKDTVKKAIEAANKNLNPRLPEKT